jgi:CBS domain-containing protein
MAIPMSPLLSPETTLKDALSMMLDADVHTGIVVDRTGRVSGLVTTESIGGFLRETAVGATPAPEQDAP